MRGSEVESMMKKALRLGDANSFQHASALLYETYYKLVFSVAFNILGQKEDAEDVAQEVFASTLHDPHRCCGIDNFKYYLLNSARFAAYKIVKSRENSVEDINLEAFGDPNPYLGYEIDVSSMPELDDLTREERVIVTMHVFYDFSFREIGEELKQTTHAISGKYHRAKEKIKQYYKRERVK